jgi:pilus assembly protein CpaC
LKNKKHTTSSIAAIIDRLALCFVVCIALWTHGVVAQDSLPFADPSAGGDDGISVPLYKTRVVQLDTPVSRVSVGSPDIADILIFHGRQLYVLGKDIGTTNVLLWDSHDQLVRAINVDVTHDLDVLKRLLHELLPGEDIRVYSSQRSIVLAGEVSNLVKMQSAVDLGRSFLQQVATAKDKKVFEQDPATSKDKTAGDVINLMTVGGTHEVMLSIKVAEIARTELKRISAKFNALSNGSQFWTFGGVNGGATFPDAHFEPGNVRVPIFGDASGTKPVIGPVIDEFAPDDIVLQDQGLFASYLSNDFLFNLVLDAAKENGLAKILAEPTLTTQSGQEAEFLSGGEFPIPVPQGLDTITIQFKEFGVGVKFLPVVLDSGQINLKINVSVSDLVSTNAVTFQPTAVNTNFLVPSLTTRRASTTVELADGQSIGIAGLINDNLREVITKFPGLGNIPILGHLFSSKSFNKGETELVIVVTPHLAKPLPKDQIRLPTDNFVEPSDSEFYFLGRLEGKSKAATGSPAATTGGADGQFGHDLAGKE